MYGRVGGKFNAKNCIVLSLCLIIVKDKWRIERKYYIFLFDPSHTTFHYAFTPTHNLPLYLSNKTKKNTSRRNRPRERKTRKFSTLSRRKMKIIFVPFCASSRLKVPHTTSDSCPSTPTHTTTQSF